MKNFFLSLKTTVWTLLALVCIFFAGSYLMPVRRDVHAPMNDGLLFDWVSDIAVREPGATWWFFASLAGLVLLTINTLVCSFQAVKGRWSREDALLRLAPQVVHLGFLLILLAHLLGAGWGYRLAGPLAEGSQTVLPEQRILQLRSLSVDIAPAGYPRGWSAEVALFENGSEVASGMLGPNRPLLHDGMGVYLKSFGFEPVPYALLMVNRDPGAPYALAGAVLFSLGTIVIVWLKWKQS